ncbi:hypothetical protein [Acidihalobacter yilgarnensis]
MEPTRLAEPHSNAATRQRLAEPRGGRNLDTYLQAGARWDHRWSRRLSTSVLVDYGAIPTASIPLQLGGLEDRIGLDGSYALTARDSLGGACIWANTELRAVDIWVVPPPSA